MRTLLYVIRGIFILVCAGAGLAAARIIAASNENSFFSDPFHMVLIAVGTGLFAIIIDVLLGRRSPAMIWAVFIGVIVGGVLAFFTASAMSLLFPDFSDANYATAAKVVSWVVLTYLCVTIILQTKDNFRFVIPYVEFNRQIRGQRPVILDTSAIIDGRIADLAQTGFVEEPMIVPSFVLLELQSIADSATRARRLRGRRGLDILSRLRGNEKLQVKILETQESEEAIDQRIVALAKSLDGRILTTDFNLNKVAKVHGVDVININDIAGSLRPVVLPGEALKVSLLRAGEEADQGVGYLDDGTMVVVEGGKSRIGKTITIAVTSVLQTSAGRMIFGKPEE